MKLNGKIVMFFWILLIGFFGFMVWYKFHFEMGVTEAYILNEKSENKRILIATQDSEFKNKTVNEVVDYFKKQDFYIQVIDVTTLSAINENFWDAILIIHTWEIWEPQEDAKKFITDASKLEKIVVFTTSGEGNHKIEHIDAITGASLTENSHSKAQEIISRINKILK